MITDLPTLEQTGVGFKFFMWDHIENSYRETGGRPDRIPILKLHWTVEELMSMLAQRLSVFSDGATRSLNSLLCESALDLDLMAAHFSQGSPRNMIRAVKAIVNEATRSTDDISCITTDDIWRGLRSFSDELAVELCPAYLSDLRKVGAVTFTIKYVSSDVFHVENQSGRAKIQKWLTSGVVDQVGVLPNPGNRPMHLYGITDLRVAVAALSGMELPMVLGNYVLVCPRCGSLVISAETTITCRSCAHEAPLGDCRTLLDLCARS